MEFETSNSTDKLAELKKRVDNLTAEATERDVRLADAERSAKMFKVVSAVLALLLALDIIF
ncbi:hypothetical protein Q5Y75_27445 [Ruegeria sp. 2205SS24-7]|uniref:hypothetical protein n=1 Tax=Ruegeria discodermiae TaxID=3064389 RepID=UPI002741DA74|nr:hypothetical protein [Ruegeria sp. 2205SS24-7]MDP5220925.1 hypothetical protein [Ruegeria sp. 2205SS24-7]